MTELEKAARQALEALELHAEQYPHMQKGYTVDAITALLAALEQPAQQEPVAKVVSTAPERIWLDLGFDPEVEDEVSFDDLFDATWSHDNATGNGIEYVRADLTRPQAREPLTDEVIAALWSWAQSAQAESIANTQQHAFARAIETAHGIKGDE